MCVDIVLTDLLSHTPSPEPRRSEKKTDNQDHVDGDKSKGRKGKFSLAFYFFFLPSLRKQPTFSRRH